eukprot:m.54221 g.54221  ORF g.54221 m.54221 type:complete len:343 (+) comp11879_c1_seq2:154-1182(+)
MMPGSLASLFVVCLFGMALGLAAPMVPLFNAAQKGMQMPAIGLGTGGYGNASGWGGEFWDDSTAEPAVLTFLRSGGRRIDTSLLYNTQVGVGVGWTSSGVPREEIFITTKTDSPLYGMVPAGYNETIASILMSLEQLRTTYIDLALIHWPGTIDAPNPAPPCFRPPNNWRVCRAESWRALEFLFRNGTVRAIGVSNFEENHLQEIINMRGLLPAVNQFEFHPYWHTDSLVSFCQKYKIQPNSYAPLGTPDHMSFFPERMPVLLLEHETVVDIATQTNRSPAQVLIRWALQRGVVVNPRTNSIEHMEENLASLDFDLDETQMAALSTLDDPPINVCQDPHLIP